MGQFEHSFIHNQWGEPYFVRPEVTYRLDNFSIIIDLTNLLDQNSQIDGSIWAVLYT